MLFTTAEIGNFSVFYAIFSDLKNSFFGPTPILIIQHKDAFIFLFKAGERDLPKINFLGTYGSMFRQKISKYTELSFEIQIRSDYFQKNLSSSEHSLTFVLLIVFHL